MAPYEMEKQDSYFDYKLRFIYSCISPICRSDNHDNNYHHQEKKKKMMMMKNVTNPKSNGIPSNAKIGNPFTKGALFLL